ncbi:MAG: MCE family protein [Prevotella sp.]|nr:MCE family protein [Prevotella sp.]
MRFLTKEVRIALVAIVGIVVMFFGMQFLKGLTLFSSANSYYVTFSDVSGLSVSAPVYANGYKVGVVEGINYNYQQPDRIVAVVGLDRKLRVPAGTTAEIGSDLLGNVKLELRLGDVSAAAMAVGDTISGGMQEGMMDKVGGMVPQIEQLLPKLDSIMASLNVLLADPAIANSLHNVEQISADLTTTTRQLNTLMTGLNKNVPQLMAKADGLLDNTNTLTKNLSEVDVAATMSKVNTTLDNVERLTARLNSKEGTLGLLMTDPGVYQHLNATMRDADSLLIDLKQHPKRYVHFSIFGKKDK